MNDLCHRWRNYHGHYSAVLGYVSMSKEDNINLFELVAGHSIFYDWKEPGCTRMDKSYLVLEISEKYEMDQVR
jgi:hypothetical protein